MTYYVIGTMSGSSLDGLDLVHAAITLDGGKWQYEISYTQHISYSEDLKQSLKNAATMSGKDLIQLDRSYGRFIAEQIKTFIEKYDLTYNVHLIGHHGHTVFHEPKNGFTYQIGTGPEIAALTGYPTVTYLRDMDVALGGEGAPIIPMVDIKLFPGNDAYINLGGICNMTIKNKEQWIAKDVTFCNQLLNHFAQQLGKEFDENGDLAREGQVDNDVLEQLNAIEYCNQNESKSLSNAQVGDWLQLFGEMDAKDALATTVEHIAMQLSNTLGESLDPRLDQKVIITGGGAYHQYLIERLKTLTEEKGITIEWDIPQNDVIDYKEALGMAFLAILRWREENNILSEWSGAERDSIGGALWMGAH